jgi:hypothetical protein
MPLKTGVADDGLKPKRRHILFPAKLRKDARSDAFCNLPNVVANGTRAARKAEKSLPVCGLCERGATKAGYDIPA